MQIRPFFEGLSLAHMNIMYCSLSPLSLYLAFSLPLCPSYLEQVVSTFIDNYFDQNPISQLAIIQVKIEPLVHFSSLLVRGDRVDPPA